MGQQVEDGRAPLSGDRVAVRRYYTRAERGEPSIHWFREVELPTLIQHEYRRRRDRLLDGCQPGDGVDGHRHVGANLTGSLEQQDVVAPRNQANSAPYDSIVDRVVEDAASFFER